MNGQDRERKIASSGGGGSICGQQRLDRWLWAARFFKTRSVATQAVAGGMVHVNGNRVRPARSITVGDSLRIRSCGEDFVVVVAGLSERRGPAASALLLYAETEASRQAREASRMAALAVGAPPWPSVRPGKRERGLLRALKRAT